MTGELVYSVQGTSAQPMRVSTLAAAGLRERDHLQEWVLANPEILGDDVLVVTAIGGSLIKPCIVGTVARTTTEETKSLGYSIYYSLVNFGGFFGPILAGEVRTRFGIASVLLMSAAVSAALKSPALNGTAKAACRCTRCAPTSITAWRPRSPPSAPAA